MAVRQVRKRCAHASRISSVSYFEIQLRPSFQSGRGTSSNQKSSINIRKPEPQQVEIITGAASDRFFENITHMYIHTRKLHGNNYVSIIISGDQIEQIEIERPFGIVFGENRRGHTTVADLVPGGRAERMGRIAKLNQRSQYPRIGDVVRVCTCTTILYQRGALLFGAQVRIRRTTFQESLHISGPLKLNLQMQFRSRRDISTYLAAMEKVLRRW